MTLNDFVCPLMKELVSYAGGQEKVSLSSHFFYYILFSSKIEIVRIHYILRCVPLIYLTGIKDNYISNTPSRSLIDFFYLKYRHFQEKINKIFSV